MHHSPLNPILPYSGVPEQANEWWIQLNMPKLVWDEDHLFLYADFQG